MKKGAVVSFDCYIQEYMVDGRLCARLREKRSDRKCVLVTQNRQDKAKLLMFLSSAKGVLPDAYDSVGQDFVRVQGRLVSIDDKEIYINIDCREGSYRFM